MNQSRDTQFTINRRQFFAGVAAVTGTVLWSSMTAEGARAEGSQSGGGSSLKVGRAMADITGEPWGAGMFGYAVEDQTSVGIQRRQYARAFIFADASGAGRRLVHVTLDVGLMFQSIQLEVLRRLKAKFGDLYAEDNVLLAATHTHVAPGGTSQHLMVDLTSMGFRPKTFEATVAGAVDAISRAHDDLQLSEVTVTEGTIADAGRNRSKQSWDLNPEGDKAPNPDGVDRRSVTLHVSRGGTQVGFINWYSIHPTSFGPEYRHISSDNKGYAAWATEEAKGVDHQHPEKAPFVAAFANATPGDITPNEGLVPGSGPGGSNEAESARILGEKMMTPTTSTSGARSIGGVIRGRHTWVDCPNLQVSGKFTPDGQPHRLGPAILGAAFAASSQEDGGGVPALGLNEGSRGGNPLIRQLNDVVVPADVKAIHAPKDCLLPVGYIPGMLQQVHPFYVFQLGGLVLCTLGFEPTITSGLRLRRTVADALGVPLNTVIVQGYTNSYGHYIATPEEYEAQNYEGGATAFGKYQLSAFQEVFDGLARALKDDKQVQVGGPAGDLTGIIPNAPTGDTWIDIAPLGKNFGDVLEAPASVHTGDNVRVKFVGANPNNNLRPGEGYVSVLDSRGGVVANDSSQSTLLTFDNAWGTTTTTIDWATEGMKPGEYTIVLRGDSKALGGKLSAFEGRVKVQVA